MAKKKPLCPYCLSTTNICSDIEAETCPNLKPKKKKK